MENQLRHCSYCGKELHDDFGYCPYCGHSTNRPTSKMLVKDTGIKKEINNNTAVPKKDNNRDILFLIMIILGVVGIAFFVIYGIKELIFQIDYAGRLSYYSSSQREALRESTGNDLNIVMLIIGFTLGIISAIFEWIIKSKYKKK